jgi:hypothetical protein
MSEEVIAIINQMDAELTPLLKFISDKHVEFEARFNLMTRMKEKDGSMSVTVNPNRVLEVCATYPSLYSWYLTEFQIAKTRHTALEEAYSVWFARKKIAVEQRMKISKDHMTQKAIEQNVGIEFPDEYKQWQDQLLKASTAKELLEKRLDIIHAARYSLSTTQSLRDLWASARVADQNASALGHMGFEDAGLPTGETMNRDSNAVPPSPPPPPPGDMRKGKTLADVPLPSEKGGLPPLPPPPPPIRP